VNTAAGALTRPPPGKLVEQGPVGLVLAALCFGMVAGAVGAMFLAPRTQSPGTLWTVMLVGGTLIAGAAALATLAWTRRTRSGGLDTITRLAADINPSKLHRRLEGAGHEPDVRRLVETMNAMLGRLEVAFLAQDRFISEVSHELKTPVSVLLLEAQVLERSEPDPLVYAKFVASVEDEMRRLSQLVESFLTLARAKHGETQVRRVSVDINDTAVEAGQHCYGYARMRELTLPMTLVPEEDCPEAPIVWGDPDLLRTMIENLLRNAIAVSPRQSSVDLSVTCVDQQVTVLVRDRGPGVPEAMASRIFERFVTADHARQGHKGSGLGLAIARGIAELHGGQIQFRNLDAAQGGGAEFSARIPLAGPEAKGR
jgi:two-component system, OmpR family, sensor kinase